MEQMVKESVLCYYNFVEDITELIKKKMGDEFEVKCYKVTKNNSLELESLVILKKGESYAPNIYLLPYYEAHLQGEGLLELTNRIIRVFQSYSTPLLSGSFTYQYEEMKDSITYRLVNYKKNRKLLESIPYIRYLDLAITFHCLVRDDSDGIGTIRITNEHLVLWKVTGDDLMKQAVANTKNVFPPTIKSMEEVIMGMMKDSCNTEQGESVWMEDVIDFPLETESNKMYILSNTKGINGATCILYEDVLREFGDHLRSDFYILPSSIHEVILVPYNHAISKAALNEMVIDVNRTQVSREEILSDRVYFYSRENKAIIMS